MRACAYHHLGPAFPAPGAYEGHAAQGRPALLAAAGGWWSPPGRRLAFAALVPIGLLR
ncbi:hypothetical protein ACWEN3_33620 [Streptomyces sp. NPDC004561]